MRVACRNYASRFLQFYGLFSFVYSQASSYLRHQHNNGNNACNSEYSDNYSDNDDVCGAEALWSGTESTRISWLRSSHQYTESWIDFCIEISITVSFSLFEFELSLFARPPLFFFFVKRTKFLPEMWGVSGDKRVRRIQLECQSPIASINISTLKILPIPNSSNIYIHDWNITKRYIETPFTVVTNDCKLPLSSVLAFTSQL